MADATSGISGQQSDRLAKLLTGHGLIIRGRTNLFVTITLPEAEGVTQPSCAAPDMDTSLYGLARFIALWPAGNKC
jgi:hypothetical protein